MDMESGFAKVAREIEEEKRKTSSTSGAARRKDPPPEKKQTSVAQARSYIDRIVKLEEEKRETAGAIKDIYQEVKSAGFDPKAIRVMVRREMETAEERASRLSVEETVRLLEAALGDFAGTGLGRAAVDEARAG